MSADAAAVTLEYLPAAQSVHSEAPVAQVGHAGFEIKAFAQLHAHPNIFCIIDEYIRTYTWVCACLCFHRLYHLLYILQYILLIYVNERLMHTYIHFK